MKPSTILPITSHFKNSFTSRQSDKSVVKRNHHSLNVLLHYLVMYQQSLYVFWIISLFSDINVSEGSVTTFVMCGGIFNDDYIGNLLPSLLMKEL